MQRKGFTAEECEGATVLRPDGHLDGSEAALFAAALAALADRNGTPPIIVDMTGVPITDPFVPMTIAEELRRLPSCRRIAMVTRRLSAREMFRRWAGDAVSIYPSLAAAMRALAEQDPKRLGTCRPKGHEKRAATPQGTHPTPEEAR